MWPNLSKFFAAPLASETTAVTHARLPIEASSPNAFPAARLEEEPAKSIILRVGKITATHTIDEMRQAGGLFSDLVSLPFRSQQPANTIPIIDLPERDGARFEHISQFMRSGALAPSLSEEALAQLSEEAEFLGYERLGVEVKCYRERQLVSHCAGSESHAYALLLLGNRLYEADDEQSAEDAWTQAYGILKNAGQSVQDLTKECLSASMSASNPVEISLNNFHTASLTTDLQKRRQLLRKSIDLMPRFKKGWDALIETMELLQRSYPASISEAAQWRRDRVAERLELSTIYQDLVQLFPNDYRYAVTHFMITADNLKNEGFTAIDERVQAFADFSPEERQTYVNDHGYLPLEDSPLRAPLETVRRAADRAHQQSVAAAWYADALIFAGYHAQAWRILMDTISEDPQCAEAYLVSLKIAGIFEMDRSAESLIDEGLQKAGSHPDLLTAKARILENQKGDRSGALEMYRRATYALPLAKEFIDYAETYVDRLIWDPARYDEALAILSWAAETFLSETSQRSIQTMKGRIRTYQRSLLADG